MQLMNRPVKAFALPVVHVPCAHCTAACCQYLALPLDKPKRARDFDDIRWYLMHDGIQVFVEDGDWYIQVRTRCQNLLADNRCGVYDTRPQICREYKAGDCDYTPGDYGYDHLFTTAEQVEEFAKNFLVRQRARRKIARGKRKVTNPKKRSPARASVQNGRTLSLSVNGRSRRKTG